MTHAEVSVTFLSDDDIQALNRSYLNHDWPTDVLSFALDDRPAEGPYVGSPAPDSDADRGGLIGDVYIGAERAVAQAKERGIESNEECVRLAVHGALHLIGLNHPDGEDREGSPFFLEQEALVGRVLTERSES